MLETCFNCGEKIGRLEPVHVWDEHTVCGECIIKLEPKSRTVEQSPDPSILVSLKCQECGGNLVATMFDDEMECQYCQRAHLVRKGANGSLFAEPVLKELKEIKAGILSQASLNRCVGCNSDDVKKLDMISEPPVEEGAGSYFWASAAVFVLASIIFGGIAFSHEQNTAPWSDGHAMLAYSGIILPLCIAMLLVYPAIMAGKGAAKEHAARLSSWRKQFRCMKCGLVFIPSRAGGLEGVGKVGSRFWQ